MPVNGRRPIRVLFANCPRLNVPACAYLILAQNAIQNVFEFEVYRLHAQAEYCKIGDAVSSLWRKWGESRRRLPFRGFAACRYHARIERILAPCLATTLPRKTCIDLLGPLVAAHDRWLKELPRGYGNWTIRDGPTLIITETPLEGGYLGWGGERVTVISLAEWENQDVPISVLEYTISQIQRYALRMSVNSHIGSHFPTRACVWDFNAHQPDAAMASLTGYLCEACQKLARDCLDESELKQIQELISHGWIGRTDEPGTVASNLRRAFSFDLTRTRGLRATFWERVREAIPQQVVSLASLAAMAIASSGFTLLVLWVRGKLGLR